MKGADLTLHFDAQGMQFAAAKLPLQHKFVGILLMADTSVSLIQSPGIINQKILPTRSFSMTYGNRLSVVRRKKNRKGGEVIWF